MYKLFISPVSNITYVVFAPTSTFIPMDEANSDHQRYLAWVAEGNIAEEYNPGE